MTYEDFVQIINMPPVLVIVFCIVFAVTFWGLQLVERLRKPRP